MTDGNLVSSPSRFLGSHGVAAPSKQPETAAVPDLQPPASAAPLPQLRVTAVTGKGTTQSFTQRITHKSILFVSAILNGVMIMMCIMCMMPGNGGTSRLPPAWGPEMEHCGENSITFRQWSRDLLLWTIANGDIEPRRQAAMILAQLQGGAKDLTREIPVDIIMDGGMINGRLVEPPTYILNLLAERYSQLGEESRLTAMTEIMQFNRRGNERVDDLLTRFDVVRQRAVGQGMLNLPCEGISWILLRACQPDDQQLLMLLQDFRGRYPANEAEYRLLVSALRRMGHILENNPGNIAQQLRGIGGHHNSYMVTGGWGGNTYPTWGTNWNQ